jgi:protein-L-isoaspartate(D-aspartate) O-methyltransferase
VQIGAGSGYYSAILAHLVGPAGHVHAFEIDPALAARCRHNLAGYAWVTVHERTGIGVALPAADAIYVNAGITQPSWAWLEALRTGGRLLFPLQPENDAGGMLLVHKPRQGGLAWPARFVSRAAFIGCVGGQDSRTGRGLAAAFKGSGWQGVRSLRLDNRPDDTCWFAGTDWWLSTAPAPDPA